MSEFSYLKDVFTHPRQQSLTVFFANSGCILLLNGGGVYLRAHSRQDMPTLWHDTPTSVHDTPSETTYVTGQKCCWKFLTLNPNP